MSEIMYDEKGIGTEAYKKDDWMRIAVHDDTKIHGFFGPFRFLSNMWPSRVFLEGIEYPSVENAYQAAKFFASERNDFQNCTPKEAKKNSIGREMQYAREEWDQKRLLVMRPLLEQKYDASLNPELHAQLRSTGDKHLEETNWWEDKFWGVCEGEGENQLGKLLMEIRK